MVKVVLLFAPFGVFALIAVAVSDFGVPILSTLGYYMFCVILGLAIQFFVVYSVLIWLFARINPMIFYSGLREAFIVAFTTSSSAATLPVTFQCVEENLGVPNKIASFVLPLGATVNMNGTSLYQAVAAIFIAQFYGLDLSYSQLATILLTSMLAAVGTAPVPGVGIIMLIMVLQSVGIPAQGIGLILGVDRILDMLRTIPNIAGDAVVSLIVWKMETKKSK
jgi:Na+/H+-dicarboxylate symporter